MAFLPSALLRTALGVTVCAATALPGAAADRGVVRYQVEIINLTQNQQFTPFLLATHQPSLHLFTAGMPASPALQTLAEEGDVMPLRDALRASGKTRDIVAGTGLTNPGQRVSFVIAGSAARGDRLSLAAMLIPTNDGFVALQGARLPLPPPSVASHFYLHGYDAGSEVNDELCASIPGPDFVECGGPGGGAAPPGGEGFVHIHNGIHGVGDFNEATRDWNNPVARVTIRAVSQ
jgi:hypothetical protein